MSMMTGPKLDEMKGLLVAWWLQTRKRLIARLEEGYPYRSFQLSPQEQIQKFVGMSPQDWNNLVARLMERHKGEPNQAELVRKDLRAYQDRMYALMGRTR